MISPEQWASFDRDGFLHLGQLLSTDEVLALQSRADELALGQHRNDAIVVQRDTGGVYEDLPDAEPQSEIGSLLYRKINGLEADDLFSQILHHEICDEVFRYLYGSHAGMSTFRAMVMNKPANLGTVLPWHQDGGTVWQLDRDPLMTVWVALDDANKSNGCVEAVAGSHRLGLLSTFGSTISDEDAAKHCDEASRVFLEVPPGHGVLIHNWTIHRSGVNRTAGPRRAFTACFLDARTTNLLTGDYFPIVRGPVSPIPHATSQLRLERDTLAESARSSEEYALSLRDALDHKEAEVEWLHGQLKALNESTEG